MRLSGGLAWARFSPWSSLWLCLCLVVALSAGACGRSDLYGPGGCLALQPGCPAGGDNGAGGGGGRNQFGTGGAPLPPPPPPPCAAKREICSNHKDDNCNGLTDCADPSCFGDPACITPGKEICNNGLDDDDDGLIDCADPDCASSPVCQPQGGMEICDNGRDDNGNKLVDCADPQCVSFPACLAVNCTPDIDLGTLPAHGGMAGGTISTAGSTRAFTTCAPAGGHGGVAQFTLAATADVRLDFSQAAGGAHVVSLFRAGANQACDQNLIFCLSVGSASTATHTFGGLGPGVYRLVVESFPGTEGTTTLTLSTGDATVVEICNNGIDDDHNGLTDCQDSACLTSPLCVGSECVPDANVGALVAGAAPKMITVDTSTSTNRYHPTCAGTSAGPDLTIAFTMAAAGGVEVRFSQAGDNTFSIFKMPAPGLACDADQVTCADLGGQAGGDLALPDIAAGDYLLIAKARNPNAAGEIDLALSAFANRMVEICDNGIDDDGNGLIDCADPACAGVGTCKSVACVPDVDLGAFSPGTQVTLPLNIAKNGHVLYQTTCGVGNGKEEVLRLTITQPMALGLNCAQTGSQVLELAQQLDPLDACNAHDLNCGDPMVLPFGCSYEIPNLQPGTYNLIVEAFQSGSEGLMTLTLEGIAEAATEICDNGIDDDGDGAIDCADLKCVTDPACEKFACMADQTLGLIPLDGSVQTVVVQTTGAMDQEMTATCVSAPGGKDQVVDFQLPAVADVTLDWSQRGDHVLALYPNAGLLLSCEAAAITDCIATLGSLTGETQLSALAAGRYHLVVDADHPGGEGAVILDLSAIPSQR